MPKRSAGILLYRIKQSQLEVLLVHPGGPFWAKKDGGAWSVPKGEYAEHEQPLPAARREFQEETGHEPPAGEMTELGEVSYSNKKLIVWALEGDIDAEKVVSSMFRIEWPPKSGKHQEFPEVDRADWFRVDDAQEKLVNGQRPLLARLVERLDFSMPEATTPDTKQQLTLF